MGNCNSAPFLQPGQVIARLCGPDNKPHDLVYQTQDEFLTIARNPLARMFLDKRTIWINNTTTPGPGVQVPFNVATGTLGTPLSGEPLSSEPLKPGTIAGGSTNLNQIQNAITAGNGNLNASTNTLPSKIPLKESQHGFLGMGKPNTDVVSINVDRPMTLNLVPKCGNNTIEKFSPETCSNICNTLNSKLTTTNVILLLVILLFIYYIFIMHRNPVKDIMSL